VGECSTPPLANGAGSFAREGAKVKRWHVVVAALAVITIVAYIGLTVGR
jgi:hypothetical protein